MSTQINLSNYISKLINTTVTTNSPDNTQNASQLNVAGQIMAKPLLVTADIGTESGPTYIPQLNGTLAQDFSIGTNTSVVYLNFATLMTASNPTLNTALTTQGSMTWTLHLPSLADFNVNSSTQYMPQITVIDVTEYHAFLTGSANIGNSGHTATFKIISDESTDKYIMNNIAPLSSTQLLTALNYCILAGMYISSSGVTFNGSFGSSHRKLVFTAAFIPGLNSNNPVWLVDGIVLPS